MSDVPRWAWLADSARVWGVIFGFQLLVWGESDGVDWERAIGALLAYVCLMWLVTALRFRRL